MIHESLRIRFAPEKLAAAREILCSIIERTRFSPGCLGCDMYQGVPDPTVLLFEGFWRTREDLDRHLRSPVYRRVILVMEMGAEHPTIRFSEITQSSGIETIKNSRFGTSVGTHG